VSSLAASQSTDVSRRYIVVQNTAFILTYDLAPPLLCIPYATQGNLFVDSLAKLRFKKLMLICSLGHWLSRNLARLKIKLVHAESSAHA
jgi:hypothetical protein